MKGILDEPAKAGNPNKMSPVVYNLISMNSFSNCVTGLSLCCKLLHHYGSNVYFCGNSVSHFRMLPFKLVSLDTIYKSRAANIG